MSKDMAASGLGTPTRDPAPTALDLPEKAEQPGSVTKRAADRAAGLCSTQPSAAQGTPPVPPLVTAWHEARVGLHGDCCSRLAEAGDALAAKCVRLTRDLDVARRIAEEQRDKCHREFCLGLDLDHKRTSKMLLLWEAP